MPHHAARHPRASVRGWPAAQLSFDHSDTLADHLRNAARAAQMRSRRGHVECLRVADGLFALTRSQYFPGLAKRRSSAGFLRQRARLERLNPCAASTCVRAARIQEEL